MNKHQFVFYLEPAEITGQEVRFSSSESHHISKVLRLASSQQVTAVDGMGGIYLIQLGDLEDGRRVGRILQYELNEATANCAIALALPCLKGERWELALEVACELGLAQVILTEYQRNAVKWTSNRCCRAQRKAVEILKQCGGSRLTIISGPTTLAELIQKAEYDTLWLADPAGAHMPEIPENSLFIIGPEAGFHTSEFELLEKQGVKRYSLGARRLRSEVAAVATLAQAALRLNGK